MKINKEILKGVVPVLVFWLIVLIATDSPRIAYILFWGFLIISGAFLFFISILPIRWQRIVVFITIGGFLLYGVVMDIRVNGFNFNVLDILFGGGSYERTLLIDE